jgi:hypothetical protein
MLHGWQPNALINETLYAPKGKYQVGGLAIGILGVGGLWNPIMPGCVHNATTWNFPVLYKVIKETHDWKVLNTAAPGDQWDPKVRNALIAGAKELEEMGVRAISGGCGFLADFQKEVAASVNVPVYLSALMQINWLRPTLKKGQKIGIITAASDCLGPRTFQQVDVNDTSDLVIVGCEATGEFANIRGTTQTGHYNPAKVEKDIANLAKQFVKDNPSIAMILLECSSLPPYAWAIQNATDKPVFDYYTMINWLYMGVMRRPFSGAY